MAPAAYHRRGEKAETLPCARGVMIDAPEVTIYTDGACSPNPGPGGWAALLVFISPVSGEIVEKELTGFDPATTNNRMEMMAAIAGLEALKKPWRVMVWTDSRFVADGCLALDVRLGAARMVPQIKARRGDRTGE